MTTFSPKASLPYPGLPDVPNAPSAFQALATKLDDCTVPTYSTTVQRDSSNGTPLPGDMCIIENYPTSTFNQLMIWDGAAWQEFTYGTSHPYAPVWSFTSPGTIGASASYGSYILSGKRCWINGALTWGAGSGLGPGDVTVTLPTGIAGAAHGTFYVWTGAGVAHNAAGGVGLQNTPLTAFYSPGAPALHIYGIDSSGRYVPPGTAQIPVHWGQNGDAMCFGIEIEIQ